MVNILWVTFLLYKYPFSFSINLDRGMVVVYLSMDLNKDGWQTYLHVWFSHIVQLYIHDKYIQVTPKGQSTACAKKVVNTAV